MSLTDHLDRPLVDPTDVICDHCGGAILASEIRYPGDGSHVWIICESCHIEAEADHHDCNNGWQFPA